MPPHPSLRIKAESLAAAGLNHHQIAAETGMDTEYARKVVSILTGRESNFDPFRPTAEDHQRHVGACLIEGGFPSAHAFRRGVAWLSHDLNVWRHKRLRRRP